jgi:lambda repressor-like predicted transcriptional regulator
MTPREIKAALILKGVTQVAIAKKLDVTPTLVCNTIKGTEDNAKVRRAIAAELGRPVREIWPDYRRERWELKKVVGD